MERRAVSRREAVLLSTGALAVSVLPTGLASGAAVAGQVSPAMHAALGEFLDANCRYHQAYRALPTGRMSVMPAGLRDQWMTANVKLRRAVEAIMGVPSTSAEDVRTKMCVKGVFFMKECPRESYWALSEALRWNAVIDREAAAFGVALPIANPEFA